MNPYAPPAALDDKPCPSLWPLLILLMVVPLCVLWLLITDTSAESFGVLQVLAMAQVAIGAVIILRCCGCG